MTRLRLEDRHTEARQLRAVFGLPPLRSALSAAVRRLPRLREAARGFRVACLSAVVWAAAPQGHAQEGVGQAPTLFMVSAGRFDANRRRDTATELGFQVRRSSARRLQPMVGGMITSDEAAYLYGGISMEVGRRQMVLRPSFAAGLYRQGRGKDLGGVLEFRSGLELDWVGRTGVQVGLELYHLSNAGLGHANPGQETLALTLGLPSRRRPTARTASRTQ